ncbi:hypothetical protein [Candidatus Desulfosporosinus nitrosoreducens]|uniref:hypothetical protein n=1 Tax=Candidatus Desulfosporosinus nitrosoreducens TaxID=3401928 RepID=UPI00280BD69B|nr:hypothetical protein [Desulfosporosinus sp. PR]
MKLDELQKIVKIKWNKFYIFRQGNTWIDGVDFEVTPDEFLDFAKQDYKSKDKKGLVGTVTNSKRAIDCQIDWIISYLGYDYLSFNEEKYLDIINVINDFEEDEKLNRDYSFKLRFIQALEIAPTSFISQIRKIRNKLEHEYILPSHEKAKETIEIAELFINATQNILFNKFITRYYIQNEYDSEDKFIKKPCYRIDFNPLKSEIEISCIPESGEDIEVKLKSSDKEFVYFLKAGICRNFHYLIKAFGYDIDKKYINFEIKG